MDVVLSSSDLCTIRGAFLCTGVAQLGCIILTCLGHCWQPEVETFICRQRHLEHVASCVKGC